MLPVQPTLHSLDRGDAHSQIGSHEVTGFFSCSYPKNIFFGQLGGRVSLAVVAFGMLSASAPVSACGAALCVPVSHVLCNGSEEQMGGIDAFCIVAGVANRKTVGNVFIGSEDPRESMSLDLLVGDDHSSVSVATESADPLPAVIESANFNSLPEAFRYTLSNSHLSTSILDWLGLDSGLNSPFRPAHYTAEAV